MKIYLDFDATLVDTTKGWLQWLKKEKNIKVKSEDILHYDWLSSKYGNSVNEFWFKEGLYNNVDIIPGAMEFLLVLEKLYGKENIFLISNSVKNMFEEKEKFAEQYFKISRSYFIHEKTKWKFTCDGILIDDIPHNVVDHVNENLKPGILFNYKNRYGWGNIDTNNIKLKKMISKCVSYSECIEQIHNYNKYFDI